MSTPDSSIVIAELVLVKDGDDEEVRLGPCLLWIGDGLVADLVEGIGRIRYELTQKDFFVGVHTNVLMIELSRTQ